MPQQTIKGAIQEGVEIRAGDRLSPELNDKLLKKREARKLKDTRMSEKLDKSIKHSLELGIKGFVDISLGYCAARIEDIRFEEDQIQVSVSIPFLLPPPSKEFLHERRELKRMRKRFAMYLKNKEKQLSNMLYTELVHFLVRDQRSENLNPAIKKYLLGISQRAFAGRPTRVISGDALRYIRDKGQSIKDTILAIQSRTRSMKKRSKVLTDAKVLKMLRGEYPSSAYPWMPDFLEIERLPRRRYLNSADSGKLRSCTVSEPDDWWPLEITVRVIKANLFRETGISYPLREIRPLLKSK